MATAISPTVKMSDVYGGAYNSVAPAPQQSTAEVQNAGNARETQHAQMWIIGGIVALVALRFLYEKAGK